MCREMAYPQIYWLDGQVTRFLNPPSLGKCLLLLVYWAILLIFLWSNTLLTPSSPNYAYKWEIVGFRAAWLSVTQLPLVYCLSCKVNVISLITGISYERLNWFHRWTARTLFLTVIVHWSFFFREWSIANFVKLEISMMPIVKYGFGAWSVIGWMVITGFGYFRTLSYELFVLQHMAAAGILLWLVHVHVPSYAAYNVWLAVGFVAFDWAGRTMLVLARNLHIPAIFKGKHVRRRIVGYPAQVKALSDGYVSITVHEVGFDWSPGQHVYLTIPRCGPFGIFEAHPFTISNSPSNMPESDGNQLRVIFKAHSGFTKRILKRGLSNEDQKPLRVFVSGPWGNPPLNVVQRSDSLILFATSTGVSFTLPILQFIVGEPLCLRRVRFYWIVRHSSHIAWFEKALDSAITQAQSKQIDLVVQVFVTGQSVPSEKGTWPQSANHEPRGRSNLSVDHSMQPNRSDMTPSSTLSNSSWPEKPLLPKDPPTSSISDTSSTSSHPANPSAVSSAPSNSAVKRTSFRRYCGRPASLDDLIRPTVEESDGETAIVGCGVGSFLAELRNYTAALSDERAVHKGTGAQGIFLFTENYGW
jgi:ferredoxin-NADP reductase